MCLRLRLIASERHYVDKKSPRICLPVLGPSEQSSSPEELFDNNVCLRLRHRNSSKVLRFLALWWSVDSG